MKRKTKQSPVNDFGDKIKEIRKMLSLSQEEFADGLDISQAALSYIESGESAMSLPVLRNLIQIYQVNPYFVLGTSSDEPVFSKARKSSLEMKEMRSKLAHCKKQLVKIQKEVSSTMEVF